MIRNPFVTVSPRVFPGSRRLGRVVRVIARPVLLAVLGCLCTRPLFHPARPVDPPKRTGTPVSVTEDISRRLAGGTVPVSGAEDPLLWAGRE